MNIEISGPNEKKRKRETKVRQKLLFFDDIKICALGRKFKKDGGQSKNSG